jgi:hypothetical protein
VDALLQQRPELGDPSLSHFVYGSFQDHDPQASLPSAEG